jgi:hypothetical protein
METRSLIPYSWGGGDDARRDAQGVRSATDPRAGERAVRLDIGSALVPRCLPESGKERLSRVCRAIKF